MREVVGHRHVLEGEDGGDVKSGTEREQVNGKETVSDTPSGAQRLRYAAPNQRTTPVRNRVRPKECGWNETTFCCQRLDNNRCWPWCPCTTLGCQVWIGLEFETNNETESTDNVLSTSPATSRADRSMLSLQHAACGTPNHTERHADRVVEYHGPMARPATYRIFHTMFVVYPPPWRDCVS